MLGLADITCFTGAGAGFTGAGAGAGLRYLPLHCWHINCRS